MGQNTRAAAAVRSDRGPGRRDEGRGRASLRRRGTVGGVGSQ